MDSSRRLPGSSGKERYRGWVLSVGVGAFRGFCNAPIVERFAVITPGKAFLGLDEALPLAGGKGGRMGEGLDATSN